MYTTVPLVSLGISNNAIWSIILVPLRTGRIPDPSAEGTLHCIYPPVHGVSLKVVSVALSGIRSFRNGIGIIDQTVHIHRCSTQTRTRQVIPAVQWNLFLLM
ncbi:hypothetical protein FGIG_10367 [Fasciola gigantica]|uniref:Uncharacterized protein n=1 Tax=Fasciola gigantica TaxID=46835 RepID=A0A504XGL4_FASGI|nr:hypothetical protein FGIG_10367 [Fasciola gigantica]